MLIKTNNAFNSFWSRVNVAKGNIKNKTDDAANRLTHKLKVSDFLIIFHFFILTCIIDIIFFFATLTLSLKLLLLLKRLIAALIVVNIETFDFL